MSRHFTASALMIILLAATTTAPVLAQRPTVRAAAASGAQPAAGFTLPLQLPPTGQGAFSGILRITGFGADGNNLFATGLITGTVTDATGGLSSIVKNVTIPVPFPALGGAAPGVKTAGVCDVLNLALGPLDVNLLGIQLHLNQIALDLSAGPDGLLGALLCTITGLLGGAGTATDAATSLNQLVGTLGG